MTLLDGERVLVTGGAGFIGSHLVRLLIAQGAEVRVLDCFDAQAHDGAESSLASVPTELVRGDVTEPDVVERALDGVTRVVHLAAAVGVGQSMYEIARYCRANVMGAAVLLDAVARRRDQIRRLVVASSMSIYGEGPAECVECGRVWEVERSPGDLASRRWELRCPVCKRDCRPLPTPETKTLRPSSVYAINKRDHEELFLVVGRAYRIPTVALRFFNVYGPGQTLGNPYTGVAAIFAARLLGGAAPLVFEDGFQSRDFVHVDDVARACLLALGDDAPGDVAMNVGSGRATTILDVARLLQQALGGGDAEVLGTFRPGDIRHCVADTTRARTLLGWETRVSLEAGFRELVEWLRGQEGHADRLDGALAELRSHGLVR